MNDKAVRFERRFTRTRLHTPSQLGGTLRDRRRIRCPKALSVKPERKCSRSPEGPCGRSRWHMSCSTVAHEVAASLHCRPFPAARVCGERPGRGAGEHRLEGGAAVAGVRDARGARRDGRRGTARGRRDGCPRAGEVRSGRRRRDVPARHEAALRSLRVRRSVGRRVRTDAAVARARTGRNVRRVRMPASARGSAATAARARCSPPRERGRSRRCRCPSHVQPTVRFASRSARATRVWSRSAPLTERRSSREPPAPPTPSLAYDHRTLSSRRPP